MPGEPLAPGGGGEDPELVLCPRAPGRVKAHRRGRCLVMLLGKGRPRSACGLWLLPSRLRPLVPAGDLPLVAWGALSAPCLADEHPEAQGSGFEWQCHMLNMLNKEPPASGSLRPSLAPCRGASEACGWSLPEPEGCSGGGLPGASASDQEGFSLQLQVQVQPDFSGPGWRGWGGEEDSRRPLSRTSLVPALSSPVQGPK